MGNAMTTAERDRKSPEPLDSRWPALMPPAQAAAYMGVKREAFRLAVAAGDLRPVLWGNRKFYRRADLDDFVMDLEYAD